MGEEGPTYRLATSAGSLRQGEILSSVVQHVYQVPAGSSGAPLNAAERIHPYAIVLSQDCDLAQDFAKRNSSTSGAEILPGVLFCEMELAADTKANPSTPRQSILWEKIVKNKDERFHYLRSIEVGRDAMGMGFGPLGIDFRRYFTIPTDVIYAQLGRVAQRRATLVSPYLEHLASRYAYFLSRVALPLDHHIPL